MTAKNRLERFFALVEEEGARGAAPCLRAFWRVCEAIEPPSSEGASAQRAAGERRGAEILEGAPAAV